MILNKIKIYLILISSLLILKANAMDEFNFRAHIDDITKIVIKEMAENYNFSCMGEGGRMAHDLEAVELYFVAYRKGTIEEARDIEVKMTQRLTELINQDKKLHPFFREYPFPMHRVGLSLSFLQADGSEYSDGSLTSVSHINGILRYKTNDPKTNKYVLIYQESFEEAKKII